MAKNRHNLQHTSIHLQNCILFYPQHRSGRNQQKAAKSTKKQNQTNKLHIIKRRSSLNAMWYAMLHQFMCTMYKSILSLSHCNVLGMCWYCEIGLSSVYVTNDNELKKEKRRWQKVEHQTISNKHQPALSLCKLNRVKSQNELTVWGHSTFRYFVVVTVIKILFSAASLLAMISI